MRDERGHYYLARPGDSSIRVYVRKGPNGYEFRLWDREHPHVWENHEWLDYDSLSHAASYYRRERDSGADPLRIYDVAIAKNLLAGEPD